MQTKSLVILILFVAITLMGGLFALHYIQTKRAVSIDVEMAPAALKVSPQVEEVLPVLNTVQIPVVPETKEQTFTLASGNTLVVNGQLVVLYDKSSKEIARNAGLARLPDDSTRCPSEGFMNVVSKAKTFTIEQQTCSGWDTINEDMVFEQKTDGSIVLTSFTLEYIDKRNPSALPRTKTATAKQFGVLEFKDVGINELYQHAL